MHGQCQGAAHGLAQDGCQLAAAGARGHQGGGSGTPVLGARFGKGPGRREKGRGGGTGVGIDYINLYCAQEVFVE